MGRVVTAGGAGQVGHMPRLFSGPLGDPGSRAGCVQMFVDRAYVYLHWTRPVRAPQPFVRKWVHLMAILSHDHSHELSGLGVGPGSIKRGRVGVAGLASDTGTPVPFLPRRIEGSNSRSDWRGQDYGRIRVPLAQDWPRGTLRRQQGRGRKPRAPVRLSLLESNPALSVS